MVPGAGLEPATIKPQSKRVHSGAVSSFSPCTHKYTFGQKFRPTAAQFKRSKLMKHYRNHKLTDSELDEFTFPHVMAMTGENLHSKAEISKELGYRDMQIKSLTKQLANFKIQAWAATDEDGTVEQLGMNESRRFDTPLYTCTKIKR